MSVFDSTLFDALTQDLDDGLILVDSCTHALHWNPAALAMHGCDCAGAAHGLDRLDRLAAAFDLYTAEGISLVFGAKLPNGKGVGDNEKNRVELNRRPVA